LRSGGKGMSRTAHEPDSTRRAMAEKVRADMNFVHSMQELIDAMIVGG
jgi:hypothetical protein